MRSLSCGERAVLNQDRDEDYESDWCRRKLSERRRVARKGHRCTTAEQLRDDCWIKPGREYTELVYVDHDGQFQADKHCVVCPKHDRQP